MEKKEMEQDWDVTEILGLKTNKFLYEVQDRLDIYNLPINVNESQIEKLFHDTLTAEDEEVEAPETTRGNVYIMKDGRGKYRALKNINFNLADFLNCVFTLIQPNLMYRTILGGIFLHQIMKYFEVDISEEQTAVCVILYQMTKQYKVTDENVIKGIVQGLEESDYCELSEKKIEKKLSELIRMGLVSIEDGRYEVTETLVFG